jgi:hypothetical protein
MTPKKTDTPSPFTLQFNVITAAAAIVAAIAATTSASLGWPVWAMFMGWVAFFTRGHSAKEGLFSYLCLAAGVVMGTAAVMAVGALVPQIGPLAFGIVVFAVAMIVVSLRIAGPMNNIPAYFLGLITFFAAHVKPGLIEVLELLAVSALGSLAAWAAHNLQGKIARKR